MVRLALAVSFISAHGFVSALRGGRSDNGRDLNSVSVRMHYIGVFCKVTRPHQFITLSRNRTFNITPYQAQASALSKTEAPPRGSPSFTLTTPNAVRKVGSRPNVSPTHHQEPLQPTLLQIQNIIIKHRPQGCVARWMLIRQVT
jgi:hypothetical protein